MLSEKKFTDIKEYDDNISLGPWHGDMAFVYEFGKITGYWDGREFHPILEGGVYESARLYELYHQELKENQLRKQKGGE